MNPLKLPFVETSAINGIGVFETLREIAKLTVPVVRAKVFGKKEDKPEEKEKEEREKIVQKAQKERSKVKEEIEFVSEQDKEPIRFTKIKFKNRKDVEQELEKLTKEFITEKK
jgi:hypothetical protein